MVWPISLRPFVKFWWGLISTLATADVRFALDSDRKADIPEGPLSADFVAKVVDGFREQ